MKKYLLLLAMLALALGFTACSNDDEEETKVEYARPQYSDEAVKLIFTESVPLEYNGKNIALKSMELTESGNYLIAFAEETQMPKVKTRAGEMLQYLFNTYTKQADKYNLTVKINKLGASYFGASDFALDFVIGGISYTIKAIINSKNVVPGSTNTNNACKTWTIVNTRVEISGVKGFYQENGCDINSIVAYVKQHAEIEDEFEANQIAKAVVFSKHGTFSIVYANGKFDMGTWKWDNMSKLTFAYSWDSDEMGFSFTDGKGAFKFDKNYAQVQLNGSVKNKHGENKAVTITLNIK